jgi:hypothetical protein
MSSPLSPVAFPPVIPEEPALSEAEWRSAVAVARALGQVIAAGVNSPASRPCSYFLTVILSAAKNPRICCCCCLCFSSPITNTRHFNRSCSQPHREQRGWRNPLLAATLPSYTNPRCPATLKSGSGKCWPPFSRSWLSSSFPTSQTTLPPFSSSSPPSFSSN